MEGRSRAIPSAVVENPPHPPVATPPPGHPRGYCSGAGKPRLQPRPASLILSGENGVEMKIELRRFHRRFRGRHYAAELAVSSGSDGSVDFVVHSHSTILVK